MSGVQEDEEKEKKGSVYTPFFQTQGFVEGFFDNLKKKLAVVQHDVNELKIELKVQKNRTYKAKQEVEAKKAELKKQMNDLQRDKSIPFEMKDELFSSLEQMLNDLNKTMKESAKPIYKRFFK